MHTFKRSVQSGLRGTSQELTFHLLLGQAAAVFSKALLGQNCHRAHCRLPTHTQSGYATGEMKWQQYYQHQPG